MDTDIRQPDSELELEVEQKEEVKEQKDVIVNVTGVTLFGEMM
jgi:hypothetical protein